VGDGGGVVGLAAQAAEEAAVLGVLVAQQLDRHRPVKDLVDRLPDLPHPATCQRPAQPVAAGQRAVGGSQEHGANFPPGF
jgi:hypothetical protein